jgi:hypothetical protein
MNPRNMELFNGSINAFTTMKNSSDFEESNIIDSMESVSLNAGEQTRYKTATKSALIGTNGIPNHPGIPHIPPIFDQLKLPLGSPKGESHRFMMSAAHEVVLYTLNPVCTGVFRNSTHFHAAVIHLIQSSNTTDLFNQVGFTTTVHSPRRSDPWTGIPFVFFRRKTDRFKNSTNRTFRNYISQNLGSPFWAE